MFERLCREPVRLRLESFLEQEKALLHPAPEQNAFSGYIRTVMNVLQHSPTGAALLGRAIAQGLSVGLDPLLEPNNSFFYAEQNHFDLGYQPDLLQRSEKGISRYLACFTGAIRRAWHNENGFHAIWWQQPEETLRAARCMEADIEAVIHLVAWELRASGAGFFWRYLLSGDNGDISVVFERAAGEGPECQFNGKALRFAFDQWFADRSRLAAADHQALEIIDMKLLQPFPAVRQRPFTTDGLQVLGRLPGGRNYLSGCLFNGDRYNRLHDPFNKVHLEHIRRDMEKISRRKILSNNN